MSFRRLLALAVVSAMTLACSDTESPVAIDLDPPEVPLAALHDVAPSPPAGLDGFHFRPPIADVPATGELDASLLDLLAVEVCAWTVNGCELPMVRQFTSEGRGPARLRAAGNGIYRVVWNTQEDNLDTTKTYRIRVVASGGELGYVDVVVLDPSESHAEGQTEHVSIVAGQALPIAFVIEQGTGVRITQTGGTVKLADGRVVLDVPEGAVDQDVLLTAKPATAGPPVVPGTAWNFGPDGISFAHPITMTIAYDPADVPPGVDPAELRIHKVVDGAFEQQNAGLVDLVNHTVSAEVDGFSVFVVFPRDPENPEDVTPADVRSIQVFDPATGSFANSTTLDVSAGDGTLTMRLNITDDITGVAFIDVRYVSPSGQQLRFPCYTGAPPTTGSDTNGDWDCVSAFPQFAEAGAWQPQFIWIRDKVNNSAYYGNGPSGFCDSTTGRCIDAPALVVVNSNPTDIAPPVVQSLSLSLDVQPRSFGPTISVDASMGAKRIVIGIQATDDLSGLVGQLFFDPFAAEFTGPSNQTAWQYVSCTLTQGTPMDGFLECFFTVPAQAESGTWQMTQAMVPDRAGNGGFTFTSVFQPDGNGNLCNPGGNCVPQPTLVVTSPGDAEPPAIESVSISSNAADVATSLGISDNLSGVSTVRIQYSSTTTTQFQECFASLSGGTTLGGIWDCTINFPQFAALGQWVLTVQVFDVAGNTRYYFRRASDGFLCYFDPTTSSQVCQDFGTTDIVLQ